MKVEVIVSQHAGTFFGRMFGVFDANVTARAVAERVAGDRHAGDLLPRATECGDETGSSSTRKRPHQRPHPQQRLAFSGSGRTPSGPPTERSREATASRASSRTIVRAVRKGPAARPRAARRFETMTWPLWHTPADFGWLDGMHVLRRDDRDHSVRRDNRRPEVTPHGERFRAARTARRRRSPRRRRPERADHGCFRRRSRSRGRPRARPSAQDVLFFAVPERRSTSSNDGSLAANGDPSCMTRATWNDLVLRGSGHRWSASSSTPADGSTPTRRGTTARRHSRARSSAYRCSSSRATASR